MDTIAPQPDQAAIPAEAPTARRSFSITITVRSMWLAALIVLALLAALFLVLRAQGPIVLLVLSIILGEAIRPLVTRLKRYRVPGPLAVLLIYVVGLLITGVLIWLLLTPLLNEESMFTRSLPQYLTRLQDDVHQLERSLRVEESVSSALDALTESLGTFLRSSLPNLLAVSFSLLSGLFTLFIDVVIVLTMALFWLMGSARLKAFVVGLFATPAQEHASLVIGEIGRSFGGYVRGILISMVLIGLLTGLGLTVLGVPYSLLLGVVAGLTAVIPFIGPWISGAAAVIVTLLAVDPGKALQVVLLFFLVFVFEGEILQPLVMSRTVHMDPLLVLFSVLVGLSLLGLIGAILAVPLAACAQVLMVRVLAPAIRRPQGQAKQVAPDAAIATPVSGSEANKLIDKPLG